MTARRPARSWLALSLLAAACGGALSCQKQETPGQNTQSQCEDDSQCGPDQVCFEDGCGTPLDFAMRVSPLGEPQAAQDFNPVSVRNSWVELALKAPARLEGRLRIDQAGTIADYAGEFTLRARGTSSVIPGLAFDQPVAQTVAGGAAFSLAVPAGIWDLTATAADPALPPVYARANASGGASLDPELVLATDGLLEIGGAVVPATGVGWPPGAVPLLQAHVLDSLERTPLSQASSPFLAAEGFKVTALKVSRKMILRLSAAATNTVAVPSKEFESDETGRFGAFELGVFGPLMRVQGTVFDADGNRIANAAVDFQGEVEGGGTFSTTAVTASGSEWGSFSVDLLPNRAASGETPAASYSVRVRPPLGAPYSITPSKLQVVAGTPVQPLALRCPRKARLGGTVLHPSTGKPLAGVLVHYAGNAASDTPGASRGDTTTDTRGNFSVFVEPGSYRVVAQPGFDRGLPWASRLVEVQEAAAIEITVSQAREVFGAVTAAVEGAIKPVPNAVVTVYRLSERTASGKAPPPVMLYEALTDETGKFKIVVPQAPETSR